MKKHILLLIIILLSLAACTAPAAEVTSPSPSLTLSASAAPEATPEPSVIVMPEATPEPTPTVTPEPTPMPTEIPKAVIDKAGHFKAFMKRVQDGINKGTFLGFTKESTFEDVAENADMKLVDAYSLFEADFLGFPAYFEYFYTPARGELECRLRPYERADYEGKITEILNKLEDKLGSPAEGINNFGWSTYQWQTRKYHVYLKTLADYFDTFGDLAYISFINPKDDIYPPDIPGMFCNLFGVEYTPEYKNEMQALIIDRCGGGASLGYTADNNRIAFSFIGDKTNNSNVLSSVYYSYQTGKLDAGTAVDFMEAFMGTFQNVIGNPNSCVYTSNGVNVNTAEEMRKLGADTFELYTEWGGVSLHMSRYKSGVVSIDLTYVLIPVEY